MDFFNTNENIRRKDGHIPYMGQESHIGNVVGKIFPVFGAL
jgi:hypothetical protein